MSLLRRIEKKPATSPTSRPRSSQTPQSTQQGAVQRRPVPQARDAYMDLKNRVQNRLIAEMDRELAYPGMPNIWWMPVQTRVEMLSTGIRSALGIKVFGDDLGRIEETAVAIERALADVARRNGTTLGELPALLAAHHGFVLNSHRHGRWEELFGMVLVEAMAASLPAIGTDCVGPRAILRDGDNIRIGDVMFVYHQGS
mgnify:CR=1 FL=1